MNTCYSGRSHSLARLFSFDLLDGPQVRLRRPHLREATTRFDLSRFATIFMNNPGSFIDRRKHTKDTMDNGYGEVRSFFHAGPKSHGYSE
jgi:hypothetical protein